MLCYHIAHLLPGLCLHDYWFPQWGEECLKGKGRFFCGDGQGGRCFSWCMSLVMPTEGRLWGPRDTFSSQSVCFCILHWLTQSTSHTISCEPWYARIFWKNFSTALMCQIADFHLMFFPVSYFVVFPLSFLSWVVWFDTYMPSSCDFFQCCLTVASCHFGDKYFLKLTWHNAPTHPSIMYWKPQKAYNPLEVTQEELCLSGYYSISNSTSATRHHILWWLKKKKFSMPFALIPPASLQSSSAGIQY